jgi:hypothetical protein
MTKLPNPWNDLGAPAKPEAPIPAPSVAESFSEHVARRSLPIVSPPLPPRPPRKVLVNIDALEKLAFAPRPPRALPACVISIVDVQPGEETEPPPLFLSDRPRPEFIDAVTQAPRELWIRALLTLGGEAS